ncbi:MAG: phosphatase PAP2 family protein [Rikenellaceae bacterium]
MRTILTLLLLAFALPLHASWREGVGDSIYLDDPYTFRAQQLILPLGLVAASSIALIGDVDCKISQALSSESGHTSLDEYLRFAPIATLWALDATKIPARHAIGEQTLMLATASVAMASMSAITKSIVSRTRPDGSGSDSYPSGHTALAFMGAEFLRMEYGQSSPWVGVAGYSFALATAYLRIYNGEHYLGDILAGAGVGLLSVKIAYWCAPLFTRLLFGHDVRGRHTFAELSVMPFCDGSQFGVGLMGRF